MAKQYYVVVIDEGKPGRVNECIHYETLIPMLKTLVKETTVGRRQVFIFSGERWEITKDKWLIAPDNQKIPLFDIPQPLYPVDPDGFINDDPKDNPTEPDKDYTVATKINKMLDEEHDDLFVDEKD